MLCLTSSPCKWHFRNMNIHFEPQKFNSIQFHYLTGPASHKVGVSVQQFKALKNNRIIKVMHFNAKLDKLFPTDLQLHGETPISPVSSASITGFSVPQCRH